MITTDDLTNIDPVLARRIIAVARSIAPGLDDLQDIAPNGLRSDAIAILQGVADDIRASGQGSRRVKSQRTATSGVEYFDVGSWFSNDDRAALRALVSALAAGGLPQGSFPRPSTALSNTWEAEIYD